MYREMTVETRTLSSRAWTPRIAVQLAVLAAAAFVYVTAEMVPVGALPDIASSLNNLGFALYKFLQVTTVGAELVVRLESARGLGLTLIGLGTAIVILAAINTSNNLLYMVLSALLAVLLLSGFLSALNFRLMSFDIRVPATCFAGHGVALAVRNGQQQHSAAQ